MIKKAFLKLHIWLSFPFGLLITIICLTGALLVFETEWLELCYPSRYFCKHAGDKPLAMDALLEKVKQQLPHDSIRINSIQVYSDPSRTHRLAISGPARYYVFANPYTGAIQGTYHPANGFFSTILQLHRWLLNRPQNGSSTGKTLIGISTIGFIFLLISGWVCWIPKNKHQLKNRLQIKTRSGWKRFFYDLHVTGGIYALAILLLLACTGLTWSFNGYRVFFYQLLGVDLTEKARQPETKQRSRANAETTDEQTFSAWSRAFNQLAEKRPDYQAITLQNGQANWYPLRTFGNMRANDQYTFDPQTGEITSELRFENKDKETQMRSWVYCLHVGSWGGLFSKFITFLAALSGASFPLTGYYLFFRKRLRKNKGTLLKQTD